jgi:hypothetical protein
LRRFLQALFLLWLTTLAVVLIGKYALHLPPRKWYPFFPWEDRFTDFTLNIKGFSQFGKSEFFDPAIMPFAYPAPLIIVFEGFFIVGSYSLPTYLAFCFLSFSIAATLFGCAIRRRGLGLPQTLLLTGSAVLLSYPFWFTIDRANIEVVDWLLVAAAIAAYWNKRWYLSATFIGLAVSCKIFPVVFLGLLLSARKYRATAWGLLVSVAAVLTSTWLVGPTFEIAWQGIARTMAFLKLHYMLEVDVLGAEFQHSLFGLIKLWNIPSLKDEHAVYLKLLNRYIIVCAIGGPTLFFWKIWRLPRANQILALTVASVLLPPWSADYTLIHLYIPWAVLALISVKIPEGKRVPGLVFSFVCLAYLMAPETYLQPWGIPMAGPSKAVVLLLLLIASVSYPFPEPNSEAVHEPIPAQDS